MGQKTHPVGLRVAVNKDWRSKWYADKKDYGRLLTEDRKIRALLKKKLESASVPKILIERAATRCRVTIQTARPGVVIGRKGAEIDKIKEDLSAMTGKEIYVDIQEIKRPEIDAQLVAENVALQLERRISFRRALKKAVQTAMDQAFVFAAPDAWAARKLPGSSSITKAAFRCTRCGRISIMASPKRRRWREFWASRSGSAWTTSRRRRT
jgi:ribosomal protein S3